MGDYSFSPCPQRVKVGTMVKVVECACYDENLPSIENDGKVEWDCLGKW